MPHSADLSRAAQAAQLYIGIMSGTSLDGADAILADFSQATPRVLAFVTEPFSVALRAELLALNTAGNNEIERSAVAANQLVDVYAIAAKRAMREAGVELVIAIGCHGQTIRHRPDLGFTTQINNPARLAELTHCDVVADFRSRDVAAGGQGAPLVPAFHDGAFRSPNETRVVVNIGGIANITILEPNRPAWGFDCGPGNCLMDAWIARHQQKAYDDDGAWAAQGQVLARLFSRLQSEKYFQMAPPKSTGRDLFHPAWLDTPLDGNEKPADAANVQATLLQLTAWCISDHIARYAPGAARALVCGGGAYNARLMAEISNQLSSMTVEKTDDHGVPAQQVEALAFAWLARQCIERKPIDLTATTGARHPVIMGAVFPA
jgi:anhydro-N-acetylmuramic acid kinase